jgi:hypothetical protein
MRTDKQRIKKVVPQRRTTQDEHPLNDQRMSSFGYNKVEKKILIFKTVPCTLISILNTTKTFNPSFSVTVKSKQVNDYCIK